MGAARANVANAVDLADFKREKDVRLVPAAPVGAQPKVIPSDVIPSFAYGRKSRPSTPINAVVGYQYAAQYEEFSAAANGKQKVRLTKASRALISTSKLKVRPTEDVKEPFKLSKFKNVGSRLGLSGGYVSPNGMPPQSGIDRSQSMPGLRGGEF